MPGRRDLCYDRAVTMPREVQSNKNNTGRYRAHPDIAIGVPASLRDLPARDDGSDAAKRRIIAGLNRRI
jgi:hypothetical protein